MSAQAPVARSIDDYDIGQLLGRGGFASVYRARERRTGSLYALKIMEKANIRKHNMESRVANEIKIQSELRYKGIVQSHCHFEDAENVYMVLELCEGGNLYRYLKTHGPLNETEASIVIKQLLLSLEYMHGIGVVHRDLKLSNVLLVQNHSTLSSSISSSSSASFSESGYVSRSGSNYFPSSSSHPYSRNGKLGDSFGSIGHHIGYGSGYGHGSQYKNEDKSLDWRRYQDRRKGNRNENEIENDYQRGSERGRGRGYKNQQDIMNEEDNLINSTERIGGRLSDFNVKLCDFGLAVQVEHPDEVHSYQILEN